MRVEVIRADAHGATRVEVVLPEGSTAAEALAASALVERLGLDVATLSIGVFGKRVPMTHVLADGDRVEVYRPLIVDPGEARRRRAEVKRKR